MSDDLAAGTLGYGENLSLTYLATGNRNLDLFFDAVPGIGVDHLENLLVAAWAECPDLALRIMFQLGDPRKGKGDLRTFYRSMMWLYRNHYDTFMLNLEHVPKFCFFGALLDLLQFACHPALLEELLAKAADHARHKQYIRSCEGKMQKRERRKATHDRLVAEFLTLQRADPAEALVEIAKDGKSPWASTSRWASATLREEFESFVRKKNMVDSLEARHRRKERLADLAATAEARSREDERYHRLFEEVARIFSEALSAEQEELAKRGQVGGLAAKWAPSVDRQHDKRTLIAAGITRRLFPVETHRGPHESHEVYLGRTRDEYRRLLSKLRGAAEVPEHFVGSGQWHLVNYARMASRCRQVHGHVFAKHDRERYEKYLEDAAEGKVKAPAAGAVLPHELTVKAVDQAGTLGGKDANLQWLTLVRDTKAAGKLPSALSVCDVSGSMCGRPMEVAIALSLLVSDVVEEPWRGRICTFSASPRFVSVAEPDGNNLADRVRQVEGMDWGMNTDLAKVFDELLSVARFFSLPEEGMAKVLFVFSDMEFDEACKGCWQTDFEYVQAKYRDAGYSMPQIVFWNLRPSVSHPVKHDQPGVAMLSGFSAGMLKTFLAGDLESFTPAAQMVQALQEYACLKVADADVRGASMKET